MEKFLQKEIENFEILLEDEGEQNAEKRNSRVRCWCGTWNNPTMTDQEFKSYLENLIDAEVLQYGIFQREKGEETGTEHFQFFVNFKTPQYFKKVKEKLLPYGCHFKPMISTAERCRAYCSKVDTRISSEYFEVGEFMEERQRSDYRKAIQMCDEGIDFSIIRRIFPTVTTQYERSLKSRISAVHEEEFAERCRNVQVTYIYGDGGVGKTKSIYKKFGMDKIFFISNYEKYLFHGYGYKKVIAFDEFTGQIKLTEMNRFLDIYPLKLRGLGETYQACYDRVFIISNKAPSELYKDLSGEEEKSRAPFFRRLHNIVFVDEDGVEHLEKETVFKEIPEEEAELPGLTQKMVKTIYYDRMGKVIRVESKEKIIQMKILQELTSLEETEAIPFD